MRDLRHTIELIWQACSGDAAWQAVSDLSRYHRIQASPGYRQAAQWVHQHLVEAGLESEILSYPADEGTSFWTWTSFQEWDCTRAMLHLIAPEEQARELANYRANPISVIQRSAPFAGEAEVVLLEDGVVESDYDSLDVAGKMVLTRGDLRRVWELAVVERGAIGIIFDGMRPVPPVRPEGDLADILQYTSFWWLPGDTHCFGFVLTPRRGQALRHLLKDNIEPVRVRASVDSRLYDGALEIVSAAIPGQQDEEIVVVAHLCHPIPSANDNASGAAAALEAARTLQSLVASGQLPSLKRTIRFLWLPEMSGSFAYLAGREGDLERMVAGVNLDMVGEDQEQTGGSWLIERPPDAAASFAPDLLARLRDEFPRMKGMTGVSPSHTGLGAYPLYRQAEVPFSGGSDHFIFSDPSVGVPMPMLIQWPDRFYHTSADTPDRVDPQSLARAGTLAAAYAYWLAAAGSKEAIWLGYEMLARFKARVAEAAQAAVTGVQSQEDGDALARAIVELDRRLAYMLDRQKAALATLERLAPSDCFVDEFQAEAEHLVQRELAWARGGIDLHIVALGLEQLPVVLPPELSQEEQEASALVPVRQVLGPIPLQQYLSRLADKDRQAWVDLLKERKGWGHHTLTALALFWADGERSLLDIAGLIELESGKRDMELLLAHFRLLEKLEFVSFGR
jgi:aminopeptidase-like protein